MLDRYVTAIGGLLEIVATFGDEQFKVGLGEGPLVLAGDGQIGASTKGLETSGVSAVAPRATASDHRSAQPDRHGADVYWRRPPSRRGRGQDRAFACSPQAAGPFPGQPSAG